MIPEVVFHPDYVVPLPAGHRFPMPKFGALAAMLKRRGLLPEGKLHQPVPASPASILSAHSPSYVEGILAHALSPKDERRLGLPVTEAVARRACSAVGGTMLTARLALETGMAANLAGGSHHAFADFGSGFCIFNDVAIVARQLIAGGQASRILVIDLDVHQGDGTASILRHDKDILTLSVHCRTNFPARKMYSDVDCGLDPGTGDAPYLALLRDIIPRLIERHRPELVFYNAGVDPHREDKLGRLELSDQGLADREAIVLETCRSRGIALAAVLGGGYADNVEDIAHRHAILHAVARDLASW